MQNLLSTFTVIILLTNTVNVFGLLKKTTNSTVATVNATQAACHLPKFPKVCKKVFDSRVNKTGRLDTSELFNNAADGLPNVNSLAADRQKTTTITADGTVQCRYEFYGGSDEKVQLKFFDFNLPTLRKNSSDCSLNESLQLLTVTRGKYEATELYCGAFLPNPILSNGPKLVLQFVGKHPPPKSNKTIYYGFKAEYRFLTNYGITTGQQIGNNCTFNYNSTERKAGWFSSPNFPGYYLHNLICSYLFHGELGETVMIRFNYFDVEGIGNCEDGTASDYVEISNFMSTDRKYSRYCGRRHKFELRSDGRFFRVTFFANDRFVATGFKATYNYESAPIVVDNTSSQSYVSSGQQNFVNFYTMLAFIVGCNIF